MNDYSEPQETKEVPSKGSDLEDVSEKAKASIQGLETKADTGQMPDQSDFSQEYVDEKTKYIDDLLAHKQNVLDHAEDWQKSGFSMENELESTDAEMARASQLLSDEFKKKNGKK